MIQMSHILVLSQPDLIERRVREAIAGTAAESRFKRWRFGG
jgi:hypothetical protein